MNLALGTVRRRGLAELRSGHQGLCGPQEFLRIGVDDEAQESFHWCSKGTVLDSFRPVTGERFGLMRRSPALGTREGSAPGSSGEIDPGTCPRLAHCLSRGSIDECENQTIELDETGSVVSDTDSCHNATD